MEIDDERLAGGVELIRLRVVGCLGKKDSAGETEQQKSWTALRGLGACAPPKKREK
jgi:hypothetical protein